MNMRTSRKVIMAKCLEVVIVGKMNNVNENMFVFKNLKIDI